MNKLSPRIVPHSVNAEQALLSSCIIEGGRESITSCIAAKIQIESFFKPAHRLIYKALLDLYDKGNPVDEIILAEKLKENNCLEDVGSYGYINEITDRIETSAHLSYYIKRVRNTSILRLLIQFSVKNIEKAYSDQSNVNDLLASIEQEILQINECSVNEVVRPIRDSIDSAVCLLSKIIKKEGDFHGISTGLIDLDRLTFGLHCQDMIVIAGRPSMGKTSLALNIAEYAILPKKGRSHPTLFFSLEMSAEQLAMRLLCSRARLNIIKLRDGFIEDSSKEKILKTSKEIKSSPFWVDDSGHMTILELRARARRIHAKNALSLVIVDYLQLIHGSDVRTPREQQIAEISRGIKSMAKELNVPVIVGCQLNRESERERRQPRLSDLRESGSIEQDADLVLLISKKQNYEEGQSENDDTVLRDLIIAKHRNGPVGIVPVIYFKNLTKFENYIK